MSTRTKHLIAVAGLAGFTLLVKALGAAFELTNEPFTTVQLGLASLAGVGVLSVLFGQDAVAAGANLRAGTARLATTVLARLGRAPSRPGP